MRGWPRRSRTAFATRRAARRIGRVRAALPRHARRSATSPGGGGPRWWRRRSTGACTRGTTTAAACAASPSGSTRTARRAPSATPRSTPARRSRSSTAAASSTSSSARATGRSTRGTGRGTRLPGWPVEARDGEDRERVVSSPAVGDIDGDGEPDVVEATAEVYGSTPQTTGRVYAWNATRRAQAGLADQAAGARRRRDPDRRRGHARVARRSPTWTATARTRSRSPPSRASPTSTAATARSSPAASTSRRRARARSRKHHRRVRACARLERRVRAALGGRAARVLLRARGHALRPGARRRPPSGSPTSTWSAAGTRRRAATCPASPRRSSSSRSSPRPAIADVDGDGKAEVIAGTSGLLPARHPRGRHRARRLAEADRRLAVRGPGRGRRGRRRQARGGGGHPRGLPVGLGHALARVRARSSGAQLPPRRQQHRPLHALGLP